MFFAQLCRIVLTNPRSVHVLPPTTYNLTPFSSPRLYEMANVCTMSLLNLLTPFLPSPPLFARRRRVPRIQFETRVKYRVHSVPTLAHGLGRQARYDLLVWITIPTGGRA